MGDRGNGCADFAGQWSNVPGNGAGCQWSGRPPTGAAASVGRHHPHHRTRCIRTDFGASRSSSRGGSVRTEYRDASGRLTGTSQTRAGSSGATATTHYRDAAGRMTGSASSGTGGTIYRDAAGRMLGRGSGTGSVSTLYDASGRPLERRNSSGSCDPTARVPDPFSTTAR